METKVGGTRWSTRFVYHVLSLNILMQVSSTSYPNEVTPIISRQKQNVMVQNSSRDSLQTMLAVQSQYIDDLMSMISLQQQQIQDLTAVRRDLKHEEGGSHKRLLTFLMQQNSFDYGATGHSGGLRHWEGTLLHLEALAEWSGRRLVLLPPKYILDPKHMWGDIDHGWDFIYNRSYDDPRFRTWEDFIQTRGDQTTTILDVRDPQALEKLQSSDANILILRQCAVATSSFWDPVPLKSVPPLRVTV